MNVADLELCKELYELSGWEDTTNTFGSTTERLDWIQSDNGKGWYLPAYDLGYLLRKLPSFIESNSGIGYKLILKTNTRNTDRIAVIGYVALQQVESERSKGFEFLYHPKIKFQQGSLEDAACKLAIELFKSGVLAKEENDDKS